MDLQTAKKVIELLDGQKNYFNASRKGLPVAKTLLIESKDREAKLRKEAQAVIDQDKVDNQPSSPQSLFPNGQQ